MLLVQGTVSSPAALKLMWLFVQMKMNIKTVMCNNNNQQWKVLRLGFGSVLFINYVYYFWATAVGQVLQNYR